MSFAEPRLLWLALLAPLAAAAALWLWRRRLAADAAWASRALWGRLLAGYRPRRPALSALALALAVLGASLALARPRWGTSEERVERRGVDVVFLLDSSLSMAAFDAPPSRLSVAKTLVRRLAGAMPGNRVALVQAEGVGVVLAPLTLDGAVLDLLLDAVEPGSLGRPGTELAPGFDAAIELFSEGTEKHRVLVVLSDGEDHGGGLDARLARLREEGIVVHAIGVGTPEGAPIHLPGGDGFGDPERTYKRDASGDVVITRLREETLRARRPRDRRTLPAGGERRGRPGADPRRHRRHGQAHLRERQRQHPGGALPVAAGPRRARPARALGAAAVRAGARGAAGGGAMSLHAAPAALGLALAALLLPWPLHLPEKVERWLYNPRERAAEASERYGRGQAREALGPIETALRLAPDDPRVAYDAGTIHLAAGRERKAAELLERAAQQAPEGLAPSAWYNLGNARLAGGDAAAAVEAYRQVLRRAPGHQEAKWNLELALRERERERLRMSSPRAGSQGDRSGEGSSSDRPGADDPANPDERRDRPSDARDPGERQGQGGEGEPRQPPRQPSAGEGERRGLPRFQDQPEMSASEAAALLQAIENLERRQRREEAARQSRERAAEGKDW